MEDVQSFTVLAILPETCFRCTTLGLPVGGILPGEEHIVITTPTGISRACLDCWARLSEEISGDLP